MWTFFKSKPQAKPNLGWRTDPLVLTQMQRFVLESQGYDLHSYTAALREHQRWSAFAARQDLLEFLNRNPDFALLFLTDSDGYLREAAVTLLKLERVSPLLAVLLLHRCNDWVPAVRKVAERRLDEVVQKLTVVQLQALVPTLLGPATSWQRWNGKALNLDGIFRHDAPRQALLRNLMEGWQGPLARQMGRVLRLGLLDSDLPKLAQSARLGAVRAIAIEALLTGKAYWPSGKTKVWTDRSLGQYRMVKAWQSRALDPGLCDPTDVATAAAFDKSVAVRRMVADYLCKHGPRPETERATVALLADRSPSIVFRMDYFRQKWLDLKQ